LKKKAQPDRQKIKSSWSKNARAQSDPGAHDCGEETDCRNDEKISIHESLL
jgi:hypothetical protein